jgi:hypothetical protein
MPMRTVDLGTVPGSADLALTLVPSERRYDHKATEALNLAYLVCQRVVGQGALPADGNDLSSPIF